jgi:hypothetical protein
MDGDMPSYNSLLELSVVEDGTVLRFDPCAGSPSKEERDGRCLFAWNLEIGAAVVVNWTSRWAQYTDDA